MQRIVTRSAGKDGAAWDAKSKANQCKEVPECTQQTQDKEIKTPQISSIVLPKINLSKNIVECVVKQAPKEYAVTSQKLAEQKGARLFQEI